MARDIRLERFLGTLVLSVLGICAAFGITRRPPYNVFVAGIVQDTSVYVSNKSILNYDWMVFEWNMKNKDSLSVEKARYYQVDSTMWKQYYFLESTLPVTPEWKEIQNSSVIGFNVQQLNSYIRFLSQSFVNDPNNKKHLRIVAEMMSEADYRCYAENKHFVPSSFPELTREGSFFENGEIVPFRENVPFTARLIYKVTQP